MEEKESGNKPSNSTTSVLEVSGSVGIPSGGLRGVGWAGLSPGCSGWEGAASQHKVTR